MWTSPRALDNENELRERERERAGLASSVSGQGTGFLLSSSTRGDGRGLSRAMREVCCEGDGGGEIEV